MTLAHEDETIPGLEVFVEKSQVVIDHGYGHIHFSEDKSPDWVDEALQFLFSALQGGVKVDVWEQDGELEKSMTFMLLKGGEASTWVGLGHRTLPSTDSLLRPGFSPSVSRSYDSTGIGSRPTGRCFTGSHRGKKLISGSD